jgi:ABC-2 type transport system ATP-binding protein
MALVAYHRLVSPLVSAVSLRVDVDGVTAIDGLTVTSTGERVLVLGAPAALFEVAAGLRRPARGEVQVEGAAPAEASRRRLAAGAPLDPPLPPGWSSRRYVEWSARLAGHGRAQARELTAEALSRMKLDPLSDTKLRVAALAARRATVIAAAIATGAPALLLADPLTGLPPETLPSFARVLAKAVSDRRTVLFAGRMPLESPIALEADEAIVVAGSSVAAQGPPAEVAAAERTFSVHVAGDVASFARAATEQGARVLSGAHPPTAGGAVGRVSIDLGPLRTTDVLRIARDSNATVLELRPISSAFA